MSSGGRVRPSRVACSLLQRIDKELEEALNTLEKEKDAALQDLDAQVRLTAA